jgi:hemoglobin-like flavoprotein
MSRQAELIRDSLDLIQVSPHAVVMLFYGRLFELDPSLRGLFKTDMRVQSSKLVDTLKAVAESAGDLDTMKPTLRSMGRRHATYGVLPSHYDTVCTALLWALGQALQHDFDSEMRAAWTTVLRAVSCEMLAGVGQSPASS